MLIMESHAIRAVSFDEASRNIPLVDAIIPLNFPYPANS